MSAIRRRIFCDVQDGREKVVIHQVQDVSEVKKINDLTRLANGSGTSSFWKKRYWVKVASIPLVLIDQWYQQGLNFYDQNDWKKIKKLLNDKDYEGLRTAPGRI
jgi:N-acetyl-anhydromuramyl-L-alanine amidase AmpD